MYLPKYARNATGRSSMPSGGQNVAVAHKTVYIYPGEDFWQEDCVYLPTEADEISDQSECHKADRLTTTVKESVYYEQ